MKQYLEDLKKALSELEVPLKEVEEILNDHREMIESAIEDGLKETELVEKFGDPSIVAKAISHDYESGDDVDEEQGYRLYKSYEPSSDQFDLEFKSINDALIFKTTKGLNVEVYVKHLTHEEDYNIEYNNNVLTIKNKVKKLFGIPKSRKVKFKVMVPATLTLNKLKAGTVNGKMHFKGCQSKQLELNSVNGHIHVKSWIDHKSHISTVNGNIHLSDLTTDEFHSSLVSGKGKFKNTTVTTNAFIREVSGNVTLNEFTAESLKYHSVSGDLSGKEVYPKDLSLKSVSGNIHIKNKKKDHSINILKKSTLSGKIVIDA
jgi:DUF4097 and DUF4098 domain-containing protein YvlB